MSEYYTGIGSRETPQEVMNTMTRIAQALQRAAVLRSGGAPGADDSFEKGVTDPTRQEIYLPWPGFNSRKGPGTYVMSQILSREMQYKAEELVKRFHPAFHNLSSGAKSLMQRNVLQILGQDLKTPSSFVVCWANGVKWDKEGLISDVKGGTGMAVRLARYLHIPIIHMTEPSHVFLVEAMLDGNISELKKCMSDLNMCDAEKHKSAMEGFLQELFPEKSITEQPVQQQIQQDTKPTGRWKRSPIKG